MYTIKVTEKEKYKLSYVKKKKKRNQTIKKKHVHRASFAFQSYNIAA